MQAKPMTVTVAKKMAADFADEHTKGGIFGPLIAGLIKKIIAAFIESLLLTHDIVPKSQGN